MGGFVEHAGIDRRCQQVVGCGDGVDVAGEMQVEILHRDHLGIAAASRPALDAKGRTLAWLADAGDHALAQMRAERLDLADMLRHVQINYVGALNMLDAVLPHFLAQALAGKPGHISLVGSVAGYRGLPQSLAYGPTKAALINLAETLYLDLHDKGIGVSIINPGFVETPLTARNQFTMPALISPEQAAAEIVKGWAQGRFEMHFPKRFTLWMKALQLLPYRLYFAATRRFTNL